MNKKIVLLDDLLETLSKYNPEYWDEIIKKFPTIDAKPMVRCMDCRYSYDSVGGLCCSHGVCVDCVVPEDFFCRYGERKGGDEC